jgi:hypothetical protein
LAFDSAASSSNDVTPSAVLTTMSWVLKNGLVIGSKRSGS